MAFIADSRVDVLLILPRANAELISIALIGAESEAIFEILVFF